MTAILIAVQSLCADMVAPPLDMTPFKTGDVIISKSGNRYKLIKARGSKDMFQLQSLSNLQVGHTKWTARQLQVAGVKRA
jgi:hypothetical protein